jgi:hypothetical protein
MVMSRLGKFVAVLVVSASFAFAQTAEVVHNVNLRSDPSTSNPAITKLLPGAHLHLVDAALVSGYYHVKTTTGKVGFVWGKNVQIGAAGNGPQPTPTQPVTTPTTAGTSSAPGPLLAKGHPVDWWFVFKFNSASFPKCGGTAVRSCSFGGDVQNYPTFSQQFVFASSESHTLQQGNDCLGDTTDDPVGATFDEVYNSTFHFIIWNDQFYDDPQIQGCTTYCGAPWAHSKGMLAWNDSGEGLVLQVSTPSWPAAGNALFPRKTDGNTLGCVKDNNVKVSQHFFALKLTKPDLMKVLAALRNASVVTDPHNAQIVNNGGPTDVQQAVLLVGVQSASSSFTNDSLSSGIQLISKPSKLHVPPWQMVSAVLDGAPLRVASWWETSKIPTTTSTTQISCWDNSLSSPGGVEIATAGHWGGQGFGLTGASGPDFNHAKLGVSTSGTHNYSIFGDMNQEGSISGNCSTRQNGRGGLFYVLEDSDLFQNVSSLISAGP